MAKQSVNATQSSFWLKLHNHILLIGGLGALIPVTNLTTGMVLAESTVSDSANSSNSFKSIQVSKAKANPKEPETPDYESVPNLELEKKQSTSDSALDQTSQSKTPNKSDNTIKATPQDQSQQSSSTSSQKSVQTQTNSDSASTQTLEAKAPQKGSKAQDQASSNRSPQQASEPLNHSAEESTFPSVEVESNEKQTSSSSKAKVSKPNVDKNSLQQPSKEKPQPKSEKKKKLEVIEPLDSSSANVSKQPKSSTAAKQNQQKGSSPNTVESSSNKDSRQNSSSPTVQDNQPNNSSQASAEQSSSSGVQEFSAPKTSEQKTSSSQKPATDNFVDNQGAPLSGDQSLPAPQAPQVKVTDRAQGCTTVVEGGEMKQRNCQPSRQKAPSRSDIAQQQSLPDVPKDIAPPKPQQNPQQSTQPQKRNVQNPYVPPEQAPEVERDNDANVLLPLPQRANLSSNFGWRQHPISGERRFHTGVDFAAAKGTPVIAARSGRVTIASYQGGYGVMVELNHKNDQSKSRYAHLSTTHVKPGEWVEKGTVIGQVGSTGHSSGPHLHFEWRVPKNGRWVAVDPKPSLFTAMDEMVSNPMAWKDNHNPDNYVQGYIKGRNWFNSLSVMITSISSEPAQWTSLPELPFIDQNHFDQLHQRSTQLSWFSENQDSVLGFSYSLPQAFASLLNWKPPQLFESPKEQQFHQTNFDAALGVDGSETFNQSLSNRYKPSQVPAKQHRSLASIQEAN